MNSFTRPPWWPARRWTATAAVLVANGHCCGSRCVEPRSTVSGRPDVTGTGYRRNAMDAVRHGCGGRRGSNARRQRVARTGTPCHVAGGHARDGRNRDGRAVGRFDQAGQPIETGTKGRFRGMVGAVLVAGVVFGVVVVASGVSGTQPALAPFLARPVSYWGPRCSWHKPGRQTEPQNDRISQPSPRRVTTLATMCALNAGLAVLLGAFGAHALEGVLSERMLETFETATRYHFYHALGLFAVAFVAQLVPRSQAVAWSGRLMMAGIVLFSGSLYALSLSGITWLGAVTPVEACASQPPGCS